MSGDRPVRRVTEPSKPGGVRAEGSIQDRAYSPHTVALALIVGIIAGALGSRFGWFAPVHEAGHVLATLAVGGDVTGVGWDWMEFGGVPWHTPRFRFIMAMGAVFEHLVALVVMVWALWRAKPLLSGIGFGYLLHGMEWLRGLREWQYLRPQFFVFWDVATYIVYIILIGIGVTYVSWIVHVAYISRSRRKTAPRHALARYPI